MPDMYRGIKDHQLEETILQREFGGDKAYLNLAMQKAAGIRRERISDYGPQLQVIGSHYVGEPVDGRVPLENMIGAAAIPVGYAGKLRVNGQYAKGEFPILLATTEAGLIAGANKSNKMVNAAGGVRAKVTYSGMTRAPIVRTGDENQALYVTDRINTDFGLFDAMRGNVRKHSKVTELKDVRAFQLGKDVHVRYVFDTGDAMGMNSATIYSTYALDVLKNYFDDLKIPTNLVTLSGNACTDKKDSKINRKLGRGKSVETEIIIPSSVLGEFYHISPEDVLGLTVSKIYNGSELAGCAKNANISNVVAAMFALAGQDLGQIPESSAATVCTYHDNGKLFFDVTFPSLEVGTMGGGTWTPTAKEYLKALKCYGPGKKLGNNAKKFAEIVASAASSQELGLLCTQARGYELAEAHARLARGMSLEHMPEKPIYVGGFERKESEKGVKSVMVYARKMRENIKLAALPLIAGVALFATTVLPNIALDYKAKTDPAIAKAMETYEMPPIGAENNPDYCAKELKKYFEIYKEMQKPKG